MGDERSESEYSRAMVVVAHPDDAEYGCSGDRGEVVPIGLGGGLRVVLGRFQRHRGPKHHFQ